MISREAIEQEIKAGFNVVCATCRHHWLGKQRGAESCEDSSCKGPARGGSFPNYEGPIPREKFPDFCLRCLNPTLVLRVVVDSAPCFGLCDKHKRTFEFVKTGDALQSRVPLVIPV